jgi:hypothetical protein
MVQYQVVSQHVAKQFSIVEGSGEVLRRFVLSEAYGLFERALFLDASELGCARAAFI